MQAEFLESFEKDIAQLYEQGKILAPVHLRSGNENFLVEIFKDISVEWKTINQIEEKFGKDGRKALRLFEKMKLVETRWQQPSEGTGEKPVKAYHTYYSSFHINTSASVFEISDVIAAAGLPDKDFKKIEDKVMNMVGKEGMFSGDVAEDLKVSATMLKALVKRSAKLDYRGHRIEIYEE